MGRFKLRGGFISNLGTPISVLVIVGILALLGLAIWGIVELVKYLSHPAATTNNLDITLGAPSPQGCSGGGHITLGCSPTSISLNVSLNNLTGQSANPPDVKNIIIINWKATGLDKNGTAYNSSGSQPLTGAREFINLTTNSGIPFKTMNGTVYLTDSAGAVGNPSTFSYP
jgi:hypothetical protein